MKCMWQPQILHAARSPWTLFSFKPKFPSLPLLPRRLLHQTRTMNFLIQSAPPAPAASDHFSFKLSSKLSMNNVEDRPRLGSLSFPGRTNMATPHYIAISSRGTVPHLTQDTMRGSTGITGLYTALEDCELSLSPYLIAPHVLCTVGEIT